MRGVGRGGWRFGAELQAIKKPTVEVGFFNSFMREKSCQTLFRYTTLGGSPEWTTR